MVDIAEATADRWDDLRAVFGARGDPPRCWCQWFRHDRPGFAAVSKDQRQEALRAELAGTPPPGVLGYDDDGAPSGWCAVAPRADYPRLRTYPTANVVVDEPGLWAVTCFVVRVGARRRGFASVLLDGAVDLARRHGARTVEAYPLDTSVRKAMANELFHGPLSTFLAAGFAEVARPSSARAVVRLDVRVR